MSEENTGQLQNDELQQQQPVEQNQPSTEEPTQSADQHTEAIESNTVQQSIVEPVTQTTSTPLSEIPPISAQQSPPIATFTAPAPVPTVSSSTAAVRQPLGNKDENDIDSLKKDAVAVFLSLDVSFVTNLPEPVLQKIASRAAELEALKSQKLLDDVSYEQSLHTANSKVSITKGKLDEKIGEVERLEEKVGRLEKEKLIVEGELNQAKSRSSGSNDSVKSLEEKLDTISKDKTHLLETLERRSIELRDLREELDASYKKGLEGRKKIVELENEIEKSRTGEMTFKLKEQSLSQEVELLKRSNEWLDSELKNKGEEFKKFRNEKLGRLSELESDYDSLQSNYDSLKKSYDNLQLRFNEISQSYDESLVKIGNLQSSQAIGEETFRSEMSAQQKLIELWERTAKEAKERIEELQRSRKDDKSIQFNELARWKAEAEKQSNKVKKLEEQLKVVETRLQNVFENEDVAHMGGSIPSTPGSPQTPSRNGLSNVGIFSPSAQIISKMQKSGGSLVQLYSDLQESKKLLENERHKNEILRREMDNILEEMEDHAPIIMAEREEHRRLEIELAQLSSELESKSNESDEIKGKLKVIEIKYNDSIKENKMITQQVFDLSRQVQHLLIQRQLEEDSEAPLTADEYGSLQKMLTSPEGENDSDTDRLISQRLVLFKDIIELQRQNENLLKVTRDLGNRMEQEESKRKEEYEGLESVAVEEAKKAIKILNDDLNRLQIKHDSIKRERDMFRSMLKGEGDGVDSGSGSSNNVNNSNNNGSTLSSSQIDSLLRQNSESSQAIKEIEINFEAYKKETSITIKTLNDEINTLTNTRSNLQIKLAKLESQLELENERLKTSNNNLTFLQSENDEIKRKNQSLQETLSKQDLKTQRVADELIEVKSSIDSLKNESSNLKAEKSLWKSIEARITKENSELLEEKGRLNGLLKNLELLSSERESIFKENERKLNNQIESLEGQISKLNQKLEIEEKEFKILSDRRDVDVNEFANKFEKMNNELKQTQEKLVKAEQEKVQLETGYKEVSNELSAAKEKLVIYNSQSNSTIVSNLTKEVEALKLTIKEKEEQLISADKHIQELTDVAVAAEEALSSINSQHEEYTKSIEENISKKDAEITNLKERLNVTSEILSGTNKELESIKNSNNNVGEVNKQEVEQLKMRIVELNESEGRLLATQEKLRNDIQQQSTIARSAQDNYEKELVKHAEATNIIQKLRTEINELNEEIRSLSLKTESVSTQLSTSESSWESQKYSYEHEIEQLKSRGDELSLQNKSLIEQIENVTKRMVHNEGSEEGVEGGDNSLREVISYLKREKEIVECNFELSQQELRRLKQQLDHTVSSLDDAKLELEKERTRQSDALRISTEHDKVLRQLEDLNVLRESNTTLRSQHKYYLNKSEELEKELGSLKEQIQPLEQQLRESVAESEAKDARIALIQEDNNKWKERAQQILQKYQRIDPAELEELKNEVKDLKEKVISLEKEKESLQQQLSTSIESKTKELNEELAKSQAQVADWEKRFNKLKDESVQKLGRRRTEAAAFKEEINQLKESLESAKKELEAAKSVTGELTNTNNDQLNELKSELEITKKSLEEAKQATSTLTDEKDKRITHLENEINRLSDELVELQTQPPPSTTTDDSANKQKVDLLVEEKALLQSRISELSSEIQLLKTQSISQIDHEKKIAELQKQFELEKATNPNGTITTSQGEVNLEELRKKIQDEVEQSTLAKVRGNAQKKVSEAIAAKTKQLEEKHAQKLAELEEEYKKKTTELQSSNPSPSTNIESIKKQLEAEYQAKIDTLVKVRDEEIKTATNAGRDAATKEVSMKLLLLTKKAEKAEKEKEALSIQVRRLKGGESISTPSTTPSTIPGIPPLQKQPSTFARPTFASNSAASAPSIPSGPSATSAAPGIPTVAGRLRPPTNVPARPGIPVARPTLTRPTIPRPGSISGVPKPDPSNQTTTESGNKRSASANDSEQDQKRRKETNPQ